MAADRQVIAYVPKGYAWIGLILGPFLFLAVPYAVYDFMFDERDIVDNIFRGWNLYLITLAVAGLPFAFRYYRLLLSGERNMVGLEDGRIIFVHPNQFSVRCADVADVRFALDDRGYAEAAFTLKNGERSGFRLQGLDQEPEAIVMRMRAVCALPEDPKLRAALAELAGDTSGRQMIIARGSRHRVATGFVLFAAITALAFWLSSSGSGSPAIAVVLVFVGVCILLSFWLAIHALLHSICSIWVTKGILYLNWRDQVPVGEVQDIALSKADARWCWPARAAGRVAARLRDGRTIYSAPVWTFSEPTPVILSRLRTACGLPQGPDAGAVR